MLAAFATGPAGVMPSHSVPADGVREKLNICQPLPATTVTLELASTVGVFRRASGPLCLFALVR